MKRCEMTIRFKVIPMHLEPFKEGDASTLDKEASLERADFACRDGFSETRTRRKSASLP